MALLGIHELVHADGVARGNHCPVVDLAVNARNLIGAKLKNLEGNVLALERRRCRDEQHGGCEGETDTSARDARHHRALPGSANASRFAPDVIATYWRPFTL